MTLYYTEDHVWLDHQAGSATVGITVHAQEALGDVVFVELPAIGSRLVRQATAGVVESVKAAADVYMPVSGEVVAVNENLQSNPSLANTDPQGAGWMFKITVSDLSQIDVLMDAASYETFSEKA